MPSPFRFVPHIFVHPIRESDTGSDRLFSEERSRYMACSLFLVVIMWSLYHFFEDDPCIVYWQMAIYSDDIFLMNHIHRHRGMILTSDILQRSSLSGFKLFYFSFLEISNLRSKKKNRDEVKFWVKSTGKRTFFFLL